MGSELELGSQDRCALWPQAAPGSAGQQHLKPSKHTYSVASAVFKASSYKDFLGNGNRPQLFLPGEFHGQRSLAGYSPWGRRVGRDSVTTLSLSFMCAFSCKLRFLKFSSKGRKVVIKES